MNYEDLYSPRTLAAFNSIENNEYRDADDIRNELERCELFSFADELWRLTAMRFPCAVYAALKERCSELKKSGGRMEGAADALPKKKMTLWVDYCSARENPEDTADPAGDFIYTTCRTTPMCRPCMCKKRLTDFFTDIRSGSYDTVKKNVNNWLSGHSTPNTRQNYIQLCYALGMRIQDDMPVPQSLNASRFISVVCGQNPLYVKNIDEAVHHFCLMRPFGKKLEAPDYDRVGNYRYAMELIERAHRQPTQSDVASAAGFVYGGYTLSSRMMLEQARDENDLISLLAGITAGDNEQYRTARDTLEQFLCEYENSLSSDDNSSVGGRKREAPNTKATYERIVKILTSVMTDSDSVNVLRVFLDSGLGLSDALYRSGMVREMCSGARTVDRGVLLLTLLSLNTGKEYDRETDSMRDTIDFDSCVTFNSFCRTLTSVLDSCGMAPLYPKRRFDFLVLYSYLRMTVDISKNRMANALSDYLMEAIDKIGSQA